MSFSIPVLKHLESMDHALDNMWELDKGECRIFRQELVRVFGRVADGQPGLEVPHGGPSTSKTASSANGVSRFPLKGQGGHPAGFSTSFRHSLRKLDHESKDLRTDVSYSCKSLRRNVTANMFY